MCPRHNNDTIYAQLSIKTKASTPSLLTCNEWVKALIGCKGNKNNAENVLFIEPLQFIFHSSYAQTVLQKGLVYSADSMLFRRTRQSSNIEFSSSTVLALSIAMRVCLKSGIPLNIGLDAR